MRPHTLYNLEGLQDKPSCTRWAGCRWRCAGAQQRITPDVQIGCVSCASGDGRFGGPVWWNTPLGEEEAAPEEHRAQWAQPVRSPCCVTPDLFANIDHACLAEHAALRGGGRAGGAPRAVGVVSVCFFKPQASFMSHSIWPQARAHRRFQPAVQQGGVG